MDVMRVRVCDVQLARRASVTSRTWHSRENSLHAQGLPSEHNSCMSPAGLCVHGQKQDELHN